MQRLSTISAEEQAIEGTTGLSKPLAKTMTLIIISPDRCWNWKLKTALPSSLPPPLPSPEAPFPFETADSEAGQRPPSLCLSGQSPRWDLCCKEQWPRDVALRGDDVTLALWHTQVTQVSARPSLPVLLTVSNDTGSNFHSLWSRTSLPTSQAASLSRDSWKSDMSPGHSGCEFCLQWILDLSSGSLPLAPSHYPISLQRDSASLPYVPDSTHSRPLHFLLKILGVGAPDWLSQ